MRHPLSLPRTHRAAPAPHAATPPRRFAVVRASVGRLRALLSVPEDEEAANRALLMRIQVSIASVGVLLVIWYLDAALRVVE